MPDTIKDITDSLDHVHGGAGAGTAIKAAWNAARPWLGKLDSAVEAFGKYAGGALAAKEGYDLVRGSSTSPPPAQPTPPTGP